jgi:2-polyprenyl-6-methoxyphenol hydroxylase-like FAD-dependent oxidoreductase
MTDSNVPVLIVGAGISGLVLAQHLQRLGVRFEIFDRDSALDARTGGWGLTLHWALPALRDLLPPHIVDKFPDTFVNKDASSRGDVGSFQFFDLKTGEALYSIPAEERIRVNRGRLRELLTSGIDVHVSGYRKVTAFMLIRTQWDKTLLDIESSAESITARFDDGTSCTGRLLVACDGARSRARQILYPDDCQMNQLPVQLLGASPLYTSEEMGGAQLIDPYIFQGSHPDTDVFMFFSCELFYKLVFVYC